MDSDERNGWELSVERSIAAPPERVWQIMTERLPEWWCPRPWRTEIGRIEWRAGGPFEVVMRGPGSDEVSPITGVLLEVSPGRRLVFTDAVGADWIPRTAFMIGGFELRPEGSGTRLRSWARHWDEASMRDHLERGFTGGWQAVADQLAALAEA
ncbi:MAG: SRPBCC domain-containing protein [Myxococcota bacterium]